MPCVFLLITMTWRKVIMTGKKLNFISGKSEKYLNEIFNFNVQAFADAQDFDWSQEGLKREISNGWTLYSAKVAEEVVCVLFVKVQDDKLFTKNTPVKIDFQGQGFSHEIKDFYEGIAEENSVREIFNYCPQDNFRMISLNEGHEYKRTGHLIGPHQNIIEWVKPWKK